MWICPVCNGLETLTYSCPRCATVVDDLGKLSDYYEPYSPYREIDDLKLTNGYPDLVKHQCIHLLRCSLCGLEFQGAINERPWAESELPDHEDADQDYKQT
ncbi:hypothetical protein CathTA2_2867 [Caldalkalibacillus thermarum TA2.A1]|uniref:Uncharacterized protein n=1 Tax=Caldalkalibacillus thermarum (strain TA2.A1) TaxID=986075 RepID=F5LAD2_CALTT|nr:hypothetical protein [Caldalkalibacillus thermarum]EGL81681.1 hypothetical protein CathTA2_2867 [Caldalkalibacillus thermarum TA2.A1]QZT33273.1 hypothetical protein HUR95_13400 [Caldalkalibacillus thermarum TA2.A1]GGK35632.1 hypothetical protein GCM10010965_30760 [Caldalkalibacillus thermarum]